MSSAVFKLPDLGEGVVEAEIIAWHVQAGQEVRVDQPLVDVMTDKATVTIPSGLVGRVVRTHGEVGETILVGAELVSFDAPPRELEGESGRVGEGGESDLWNGLTVSYSPPLPLYVSVAAGESGGAPAGSGATG